MRREEIKPDDQTADASRFSLGDLLAMLHRRRWLIVITTVLISLIVTGLVMIWPNRYEAVAVVQLDPRMKKVTQFENVYEGLRPDTPTIESEAEIAISGPVLRSVMDRLGLAGDPDLYDPSGPLDEFRRMVGLPPRASQTVVPSPRRNDPAPSHRPDDFEQLSGARGGPDNPVREPLLMAFNNRVSARRLRNTQLIEIRYNSRDPVRAARIATAIAESYILAQINSNREAAEVVNAQIEKRVEDLRSNLATTERAIEQLRTELGVYQAEGGQLSERQLAREMEGLVQAQSRTAEATARFEEARRAFPNEPAATDRTGAGGKTARVIPDGFRSPTLRALEETVEKIKRRVEEVRQKYGTRHPERQRAEAELAAARAVLQAEHTNIVATARTELAIARENEQQLSSRLVELKADISRLKDREWQLKALEREAKSSREIYEHLLSRRKQTAEAVELQIADARVIDRAMVPLRPVSPKRKQIVIISVIGALMFAVGLALLLEFLQPGIAGPSHAERDVDLALIAAIPTLEGDFAAHNNRDGPASTLNKSVSEIRHALDDGRPPGRQLTVLLASALPGEGKSLIAQRLADQYAIGSGRTLLIDADLRRGKLTRQRLGRPFPGLAEVLAGTAKLDDCLKYDAAAGCAFLPSGLAPDFAIPASILLASPAMPNLMSHLAHEFDTIIIDAPPLLPVVDGRILAQYADDIVFVATVRKTPKDQVRRALKTLGQNSDKVLGIVLNHIDRSDRYYPHTLDDDRTGKAAAA